MKDSTDKVTKVLFILISALIIAAIVNNLYTFYFQKDYDFTVEASCDPVEQACFIRDCSDGECPPNELERYRVFALNANDFQKCSDDSCIVECSLGQIDCEEILCDESGGDVCTTASPE
ncbi:MAG: hypothetical protein WAX80_02665 [Minisyncoccia bacterium]